MQLIVLVLLAISFRGITSQKTKVIQTTTGKVQGDIEPTAVSGKFVQKFSNIPYAEPPVGKLRFAKPMPKKPWNGTLNSSCINIACWQIFDGSEYKLTEDCLILNIWTSYPQKTNQSVMVWIHGGSFRSGYSGLYAGHNFVAVGDVILVTINYRLSVLGFLTTSDDRIKGNFGLFDQRLAMKWVKDNIASFGGNPQSITIFGESAGGASVSAHTLSKDSWPYFNRAILQSGNMIMPWAIVSKPKAKDTLNAFLKSVSCPEDDKLLECLQNNVTENDLQKIYILQPSILMSKEFGGSVDGDFFPDEPKKLLENGTLKKDAIILGVTKDEGFLTSQSFLRTTRNVSELKKNVQDTLKFHLLSQYSVAVYNQTLKLYQPECIPSFVEAVRPITDFYTDTSFLCATTNEAMLRSLIFKSTNIYLYQLSYSSPILDLLPLYPMGRFGFAAHAVDVAPVFGKPINAPHYPAEDQILSQRMILYWTNFAKHGDPNVGNTTLPIAIGGINSLPKWPKFTNSSREFIDMESLTHVIVGKRLREKYCDFWKDPEGFTKRANQHKPATTMPASADPVGTTKHQATTPIRCSGVKHIAQVALMVVTLLPIINQTF